MRVLGELPRTAHSSIASKRWLSCFSEIVRLELAIPFYSVEFTLFLPLIYLEAQPRLPKLRGSLRLSHNSSIG